MLKPAFPAEGGFSLVETMVALVLLSISLLGALSMFAVAQEGISGGAKRLEALALAETKMERMRAAAYQTLQTEDVNGDGRADVILEDRGMDGDAVAGDGEYTARRTVNGIVLTTQVRPDQPVLARSRATMIRVTAAWSDYRGRHRTVRLGMRRANPAYGGPVYGGSAS